MNKWRKWAFIALMFVPFIYKNIMPFEGMGMRDTQESFLSYIVICMTALYIGNVWLGAFLALNVALYIYNGQEVGSIQILNVLFGCLLFMFSRDFFKKNKFSDFYPLLLGLLALNLVWMSLQLFHIDPIFTPQNNVNGGTPLPGPFTDPSGFLGIKMANGIYMTLMLPILAAVSPFLSPFMLIPLWLTQSSGVFLAIGVVSLFYTYHIYRKVFFGLLIVLPILGSAYLWHDLKTDPKTFTSRFPVWHSAISETFKNPYSLCGIIGYGPDSYRNTSIHKNFKFAGDEFYNHGLLMNFPNGNIAFRYYSPTNDEAKIKSLTDKIGETKLVKKGQADEWDNPHNIYVNLFFQYGWLGLILLFGLTRELIKRFKYSMKSKELIVVSSGLLVYYVTGIVHFPLDLARTAYLFPVLLGVFYAITDEKDYA